MDLKQYYTKIREKKASFKDPYPVVISLETGGGGRHGVLAEVTPDVAARMVIEGTAQEASEEQAKEFRRQRLEAARLAQEAAETAKVQVALVSSEEFKRMRSGKSGKD